MNWRAIGCGAAALAAFLAVSVIGLLMALPPAGCPDRLQHGPDAFLPTGEPTTEPRIPGVEDEEIVEIGSTFMGLTTRAVFAASEEAPVSGSDKLPARIALDCADGTYLAYRSEP
ncbi:MAG: hypothetical protein ACRDGV_09830 [Candidatus Limnocylindria bacterium]